MGIELRVMVAFLLLCVAVVLPACARDECRSYSRFTCDQLERQRYNVFYYDVPHGEPQQQEVFAGQVVGLKACGMAASSTATLRVDEREGDWSYVCCLQTDESSCAEKHR